MLFEAQRDLIRGTTQLRFKALVFFYAVTDMRRGHRATLTTLDHRRLRWEVEIIALHTELPAFRRRCEEVLATERARRIEHIQRHRRRPAPSSDRLPLRTRAADVIPFPTRAMACDALPIIAEA